MPEQSTLGAPGPYMVCQICRRPLNLSSTADPATGRRLDGPSSYQHTYNPLDPADHDPMPVIGTPLDALGVCDFCQAPGPPWVYVPRSQILLQDPLGQWHDYSSPWACCDGCNPLVARRDQTRLLARAAASPHGFIGDSWLAQQMWRQQTRQLYAALFRSDPAGPYEIRIPDDSAPSGTPHSNSSA